ncbi:hypothetical protein R1flu_026205 [Riccia fluitans]|uniref:Protein kinase domain-containing protein n=1 Tax=Riccia fluitans TaxID=41844 RepID=A0ABD1XFA8_9MARC
MNNGLATSTRGYTKLRSKPLESGGDGLSPGTSEEDEVLFTLYAGEGGRPPGKPEQVQVLFLTFKELQTATSDFSDENIVDRNGYCVKYIMYKDTKEEDDKFISVLEGLPSGTLGHRLCADQAGKISWEVSLGIALDIANGLSYIHVDLPDQEQLVHFNLSPSSIFFFG